MKEKTFELLKNLHINYYQGCYDIVSEAIELTTQLYCEINNIDREVYDKHYMIFKETVCKLYPYEQRQGDFENFINQLIMLLDGMNYTLTKDASR